MKTVLFARVSSRDQEETGYSLPSQEKLLKEYAERKDFKVAKMFSISESAGGKFQRKAFDEMLDYIRKNDIKSIVCEKVDRLTRNLKSAVLINEWLNENAERQVHFVKENCILSKDSKSNDKFIWNIKVSTAQYYIDNLSEEVKKGQKEKIAQGWLPQKPPLGYKTTGDKGHKIHIIDEGKASLVKKMFDLYADGNYSIKKLSEMMFGEGLRTYNGNKLCKSRMATLLSDPFYYGKMRWNNEISNGEQEPLISEELFNKVQDILRGKTTPKYNKHFYMFSGLVKCNECQGTITWEEHKGTTYGHCNHYRNCSQKVWVKQPDIEKQVLESLGSLAINDKEVVDWVRNILKAGHKEKIDYHTTSLKELNQGLNRVQKRIDNLYDDKVDEKISIDFYERKFKEYSKEKETILTAIKKQSEASDKYSELGIKIYELSQKGLEIYEKKKLPLEKRRLFNLAFDKLSLEGDRLILDYSKAFEVLFDAVSATNSSKVPNLAKLPTNIFELRDLSTKTSKNRAFNPAFDGLLRR